MKKNAEIKLLLHYCMCRELWVPLVHPSGVRCATGHQCSAMESQVCRENVKTENKYVELGSFPKRTFLLVQWRSQLINLGGKTCLILGE